MQDAITNQEVWLRKVGTKNNVADGLTKTVHQHVLRNMLTTLKMEQLSKQARNINLLVCKNKLMGAEDSDASSPGRQSKYRTQEHRDGLPRKLHRDIVMDYRENCKNIVMDCRRKLQEHRDGLPRKLQQEDRDGWPRKLQQEDRDGWPRKLAEKIATRRS